MGLEEVEIGTEQLAPGMYVCRLDRPWTDTPFLLQGFTIGNEELAWLKSHCRSVWIDVVRGPGPRGAPLGTLQPGSNHPAPAVDPESLTGSVHYRDTATLEQELPEARRAHELAAKLAKRILDDVRAGQKVAPAAVRDAVAPIVGSVLRSADTLFWVNALQKLDAYSYSHAINCSALAAAFGRHLGLPESMLIDLASGGLLLDVGKARLPEQLLSHPGPLDAAHTAQVREHVAHGLAILGESGQHGHAAVEMVRTHHERWDGSGYPRGLTGTATPLFGRMAGIIDSFDAMTSQRPHAAAIARHEALQQIYRHRDTLYQGEMVEQFIGCLGVYPTGSLVELSTGEVAVVMAQNPTRRLRPRVMLLTDPDKKLREHFVSLDLMVQAEGAPREEQVNVTTPLPIGAYGLDPAELYL